MITISIILGILTIFIIGFVVVFRQHFIAIEKIDFANEYRKKFIGFAKKYFKSYDLCSRSGDIDGKLYIWLTMNVSKIQEYVGLLGELTYKPAYQNYFINDYLIIINTLPKFRDGQVEKFDVSAVDDCLLRYIGQQKEYIRDAKKNLKNPIVWFREGFREIASIPVFILSWFGIISNHTVNSIKNSLIYKTISGLAALVSFISGIVTIIVGYDQIIEFVNNLMRK